MIFTTECFVVQIPETSAQLTFSYPACAASDIALLALTHGNFSVPILDFLDSASSIFACLWLLATNVWLRPDCSFFCKPLAMGLIHSLA